MEMQELDDAYAHIESTTPEQLRAAINRAANDKQALSPLLAIASAQSQSTAGPSWLRAIRQPRYTVLAIVALIAGLGIGSAAAGRACSGSGVPGNARVASPIATSPVFGPQAAGTATASASANRPVSGAGASGTAAVAANQPGPGGLPTATGIPTQPAVGASASPGSPATPSLLPFKHRLEAPPVPRFQPLQQIQPLSQRLEHPPVPRFRPLDRLPPL